MSNNMLCENKISLRDPIYIYIDIGQSKIVFWFKFYFQSNKINLPDRYRAAPTKTDADDFGNHYIQHIFRIKQKNPKRVSSTSSMISV